MAQAGAVAALGTKQAFWVSTAGAVVIVEGGERAAADGDAAPFAHAVRATAIARSDAAGELVTLVISASDNKQLTYGTDRGEAAGLATAITDAAEAALADAAAPPLPRAAAFPLQRGGAVTARGAFLTAPGVRTVGGRAEPTLATVRLADLYAAGAWDASVHLYVRKHDATAVLNLRAADFAEAKALVHWLATAMGGQRPCPLAAAGTGAATLL
jgi:hypothetical protein